MKMKGIWLSGLIVIVALLVFFSHAEHLPPSGKYHPKTPARSHTSTVTVLNPALLHRLNMILEHGLIQGD